MQCSKFNARNCFVMFISWNQNFVKGFPLLNYPNVCTDPPQAGKAFCEEHVAYLTSKHPDVPTDIRAFLKYCGIQRSNKGKQFYWYTGMTQYNLDNGQIAIHCYHCMIMLL